MLGLRIMPSSGDALDAQFLEHLIEDAPVRCPNAQVLEPLVHLRVELGVASIEVARGRRGCNQRQGKCQSDHHIFRRGVLVIRDGPVAVFGSAPGPSYPGEMPLKPLVLEQTAFRLR